MNKTTYYINGNAVRELDEGSTGQKTTEIDKRA